MANKSLDREIVGSVSRRKFMAGVGVAVAGAAVGPTGAAEASRRTAAESGGIKLFNGKDLTGLYTHLRGIGLEDPDKVFTVHDGMIHISGKTYGGVYTNNGYENYRVVVEFKWGEVMHQPGARDSGLLLHGTGGDGGFRGDWMESVEFQMYEGATGDFILLSGKDGVSVTVEGEMRADKLFHYVPGKPATVRAMQVNGEPTGITYIIPHENRDPNWKSALGFRGKDTAEAPVGEWNTIEAICDGDTITNIVNGRTVNKATNVKPSRGRLGIQSEGAELFVRRWELFKL
jgi:hypothetical protein